MFKNQKEFFNGKKIKIFDRNLFFIQILLATLLYIILKIGTNCNKIIKLVERTKYFKRADSQTTQTCTLAALLKTLFSFTSTSICFEFVRMSEIFFSNSSNFSVAASLEKKHSIVVKKNTI